MNAVGGPVGAECDAGAVIVPEGTPLRNFLGGCADVSTWWIKSFILNGPSKLPVAVQLDASVGLCVLAVALVLAPRTLARLALLLSAALLLGLAALLLRAELASRWRRARGGLGQKEPLECSPEERSLSENGATQAEAPAKNWRVVSVYGLKIRVSEDGTEQALVDPSSHGETFFPAPPDDDIASTEGTEDELPLSLSLPFMHLERRPHEASGKPELWCTWLEGGDFVWEDMETALDYLDRFSLHTESQQGFALLYDFRELGVLCIRAFGRLLEFSKEPTRKARWARLNFSVTFVLAGGPSYYLGKAILASWLAMRPPLTRTILLTDPCQPEEDAVVWDPAPAEPPPPPLPAEPPPADAERVPQDLMDNTREPESEEVNQHLDRYLNFVSLSTQHRKV